jgi:hypothetical protein
MANNKLIEALEQGGWAVKGVDTSTLSVVGGERVVGKDDQGGDCYQSKVIMSFVGEPGWGKTVDERLSHSKGVFENSLNDPDGWRKDPLVFIAQAFQVVDNQPVLAPEHAGLWQNYEKSQRNVKD